MSGTLPLQFSSLREIQIGLEPAGPTYVFQGTSEDADDG